MRRAAERWRLEARLSSPAARERGARAAWPISESLAIGALSVELGRFLECSS